MEIYKTERKIYNETLKESEMIESIEVFEKGSTNDENTPEPVEEIKEIDSESPKIEHVQPDENSEPEKTVLKSDKQSKNINIRLGLTMINIMIIYGIKKDRVKAQRFKEEAEKFILTGAEGNQNSQYYVKYL
jgi:hypothetical protein